MPPTTDLVQPLTESEREEFKVCEKTIALGLGNFIEVGLALAQIRDKRLYRERFQTFSQYVEIVWQMSADRARQLRRAAATVQSLATVTNGHVLLPENERQARALMAFDPDLHPAIMKIAAKRAEATNRPFTEAIIARVGEVLQQAAETGAVDTGNGESTPLDASITVEDYEAMQRQNAHIADRTRRVRVPGQVARIADDYVYVAIAADQEGVDTLKVGSVVAVSFLPPSTP